MANKGGYCGIDLSFSEVERSIEKAWREPQLDIEQAFMRGIEAIWSRVPHPDDYVEIVSPERYAKMCAEEERHRRNRKKAKHRR